jgi:hypothetical protein
VISKNPSPDQKFADSTINIHVHVHVDYEFPRQVETCDNTCDIKKTQPGSKIQKFLDSIQTCDVMCDIDFFQPGLEILRTETDNRCHV